MLKLIKPLFFFLLTTSLTLAQDPLTRLSELVKIKTISVRKDTKTLKEFQKAHRFLKQSYPKVFSNFLLKQFKNSYLFYVPSNSSKKILLNAHYDVVDIDSKDLKKWKFPPFSGEIKNELLWGRGTIDDKASVISLFETLNDLPESHPQIYVSITHDEEVGGENGAKKISEYFTQKKITLDAVLMKA